LAIQVDPKNLYPSLFLWLLRVRQGHPAEANGELATCLGKRGDASPGDWSSKIAGLLLDKVTEADFFAVASSPETETDRGQHCEGWYYAGMKRLLAGDKKTGGDYFRKCIATEEFGFTEYLLAQVELKTLGTN
jgi:lipoprotein NlpI